MQKRLAVTKDGRLTYCTATEENIGKGRCNHVTHQKQGESQEDFLNRNNILSNYQITDREINDVLVQIECFDGYDDEIIESGIIKIKTDGYYNESWVLNEKYEKPLREMGYDVDALLFYMKSKTYHGGDAIVGLSPLENETFNDVLKKARFCLNNGIHPAEFGLDGELRHNQTKEDIYRYAEYKANEHIK